MRQEFETCFDSFPEILDVVAVSTMLGLSKSMVYKMLQSGSIEHVRLGAKYLIPKANIIDLCMANIVK